MNLMTSIEEQDRRFAAVALGTETLVSDQLSLCSREGLLPLASLVAPEIEAVVRQEVHQAVAVEMAHHEAVAPVLGEIAGAGIDALVLKGSALAYSAYAKPWQRLRNDTDLLVRESDRQTVCRMLIDAGFQLSLPAIGTTAYSEQAHYFTDSSGLTHCIDLHWRINNNWLLSRRIGFDDLWWDRRGLDELARGSARCSDLWMVIVACLHRAIHLPHVAYREDGFTRRESDYTLWMYDIHLLVVRLEAADWDELVRICLQRGLARLVLDGLERSRQLFGSPVPDRVLARLSVTNNQLTPSALSSGWHNFAAVHLPDKPAFVRQRLFPCRAHMDARYGTDTPLALRHLRRWQAGVARHLPCRR